MNTFRILTISLTIGFFLLSITFPNQLKAQSSLQNEGLSLSKAIELAVNNQPLIKEAEDRVSIAKAKTDELQSSFYPQVNAQLNYNFIGPLPYIQLPFAGAGDFYMAAHSNYDENVAVNYLVYDFDRRKETLKLLQSSQTTESEKIKMIRDQLAYQTASVFYTMLYLKKNIEVMNQQIQDLNEHNSVARKLVLTGSATGLDTLTTNVKLIAFTNQKVNEENQLRKTEVVLRSLMNDTTRSGAINLMGDLQIINQEYTPDSLISEAYVQREELIMNKLVVNTVRLQKGIIAKSNMPVLDAHGNFGFKNGYPDNLTRLRANYVVGLSAAILVFDGHLLKSKLKTADWNIETTEDHASVLRQNIRTEVEQALLDYNNNRVQLKTAEEEIAQAEAAIKQAKGLYESGSITNTTLLDTETSLDQAQLKYTYQLYLLTLSHYKLMQSIGEKIW